MKDFYAGKRILVTGSEGFVGRHLCRRLKDHGVAMLAKLDRHGVNDDGVNDSRQVLAPFDVQIDLVFHLAAFTEVRASYDCPGSTYRTNVLGTLNVLDVCRQTRTPVVVASTDKVYGNDAVVGRPYWSRENDQLQRNADMYAASKQAADLLAQDYARLYRMPVRVLRCANTYGPGQRNETTLITGTCARLARGQRPVIYSGSRYSLREWLHVDDAVSAYLLAGVNACEARTDDPVVYNVGGGHRATVEAVVDDVIKLWGGRAGDFDLEADTCPQIDDQGLDSSRFRERFPEWTVLPWREGLAGTVNWYRENLK